jgi:hypothetical protein
MSTTCKAFVGLSVQPDICRAMCRNFGTCGRVAYRRILFRRF